MISTTPRLDNARCRGVHKSRRKKSQKSSLQGAKEITAQSLVPRVFSEYLLNLILRKAMKHAQRVSLRDF